MKSICFIKVLFISLLLWPCIGIGQTWKINLQQANISTFLTQVSEVTGSNFIIDPRVKGKVTVVSNTELDKKGVLRLLFAVLSVHGYAAVQTPEGIKIVPDNKAKQTGLPLESENTSVGSLLVTQVIALKNIQAIQLIPVLRPLIPAFGHLAAVKEVNALIVSDRASNIRNLEKLIQRLDHTSAQEIRVVPLVHAWVADVLTLLNNLNDSKKTSNGASSADAIKVIADENVNRFIIKGESAALDKLVGLIKRLDQPAKRSSRLYLVPLHYADATETAELLSSLVAADPQQKSGHSQSVIKADKTMNRLVISALPNAMADLSETIKTLDVPRAQVLIEAIIVEITLDNNDALGLQWLLSDSSGSSSSVAGVNSTTAGRSIVDIARNVNDGTQVLGDGVTLGGGFSQAGGFNLAGVLQAISSHSNANLLSTPKIMTLDNQTSKILVGETRPFQTGGYSDTSNNAFITTERHDIGLTLEVTPHINAGDKVKMDVSQIVEAASAEQSSLGTITTKREITTTVIAGDNETIVLGGLMQDNTTRIEQKVPLFGDIPVLGALFRSQSLQKTKRNLLVFIRPTILRNKKHISAVTNDSYQAFRSIDMAIPNEDIRPATVDSLLN